MDVDLVYLTAEESFTSNPVFGDISVMVGTYTSLDFSFTDNILCGFSGYSPMEKWIRKELKFPKATAGQIKLLGLEPVPIGAAVDYNRKWNTYFDTQTGVFCLGTTHLCDDMQLIEFGTNMVAALLDDRLASIWLLPRFI